MISLAIIRLDDIVFTGVDPKALRQKWSYAPNLTIEQSVIIKMELNLSKYNATSLGIKVSLEADKTVMDALKQCYPKQALKKPDKFIEFGSDYKVTRKRHSARGLVQKTGGKEFQIYLYYAANKLSKLFGASELQPLDKMLSCLMQIKTKLTFEVDADFKYSGKKFISRMKLPIKLSDEEHFDEVRGLRLVKLAEGKKLFSLIIDRPNNEEFYHTVYFSYVGNMTKTLPMLILEEAVNISKRGLHA